MTSGALAGVRILDLGRMLPAPWATQILADLGADVIKVEDPRIGDASRRDPPFFGDFSAYFSSVNRNKRSLAIDLRTETGRNAFLKLAGSADVIIQSFSVGVVGRLGVAYKDICEHNPDVVYCSISAFGQTGAYANQTGHDLIFQALSGLVDAQSRGGVTPSVPTSQVADYATGSMLAIAILAALRQRDSGGGGQNIDLSMFACLFSMNNLTLLDGLARISGAGRDLPGIDVWGGNPRYAVYPTADGKAVAASLVETRFWNAFCDVAGRPDLKIDKEDPSRRHIPHLTQAEEQRQMLADYFLERTRDCAVTEMQKHKIPVVPVLSGEESLQSDLTKELQIVQKDERVNGEPVLTIANPLQGSGMTRSETLLPPGLGQNSRAVLSEAGVNISDIEQLITDGVVVDSD